MKKKVLLGVGAGLCLALFSFIGLTNAQEFRQGNNATIGSTEKIDSSAYLAGRHIDVAGEINGDLFCAGQTISVSGIVHGDVICAGQTITLTGKVDGDVRIASQSSSVGSIIEGNLTSASQDLTITANAKIGRDVTGGATDLVLNGYIGRDLVLGSDTAIINGNIARNIKSNLDNLTLGKNARVGGNIEYTSNNELNKSKNAQVDGTVSRTQPARNTERNGWFGIGFRIYWFFAMLLIAMVLVLLFPAIFEASAVRTMASFGLTLIFGIVATLFTPIIFGLLMITIIGIPLGIILMFGWIMALILSGPFTAYLIGRELWRSQKSRVLVMLLGAVLLLLIYQIPILGAIALLAAVFIGMGMIVRELTARTPRPVYRSK
jgi:cytoskeletal protein CcmA (bactofilin family)